eukprot:GAFH01001721.1.p4 GENE.GAFH01001721.1~~GAFH01001721.1.p4  ORF type:complete len:145 (-),score=66.96 GAFH01001721.1:120-554(-)
MRRGVIMTTRTRFLPLTSVLWIDDSAIVAAGHDCSIGLFHPTTMGQPWQFVNWLDQQAPKSAAAKPRAGTLASNAFKMFESATLRGASLQQTHAAAPEKKTAHANTITQLAAFERTPAGVAKFTTSSLDGKVLLWTREGAHITA